MVFLHLYYQGKSTKIPVNLSINIMKIGRKNDPAIPSQGRDLETPKSTGNMGKITQKIF